MTPEAFTTLSPDSNLERLCHAVHGESGVAHAVSGANSLSAPQLTAYCVEVFFGLTLNGGFQSLFNGAYQWTVPHSANALRTVNLPEFADVMDNAVQKLFPDGVPSSAAEYDSVIERLYDDFDESELVDDYEDPFEIYEDRFWNLYHQDEHKFRLMLHKFICDNQAGFVVEDAHP